MTTNTQTTKHDERAELPERDAPDEQAKHLWEIYLKAAKISGSALLAGESCPESDKEALYRIACEVLNGIGCVYYDITGEWPNLNAPHKAADHGIGEAQPAADDAVVGTKTWFGDGKVITQNLTAKDVYKPAANAQAIHSCSYYCDRPECIKAQRDELRRMFEAQPAADDKAVEPFAWWASDRGVILLEVCRPSPDDERATLDWKPLYTTPPTPAVPDGAALYATPPQQEQAAPGAKWKSGSEFLPYHPQASHVSPDYRDGWNACFAAALQATP